MITATLLQRIMPLAGTRADEYAPHWEAARQVWVGDDWHHVAMWLAQIAHESGELRYTQEIASGEAYEGRDDLGNSQPGDGRKFKGRGLLQVTGRDNYTRCGYELNLPLVERPELLEQARPAAASAGWVWKSHKCPEAMSEPDPLVSVTRRINGGLNGLESRRNYYVRAMAAMKAGAVQEPGLQVPPFMQDSAVTRPSVAVPPPTTAASSPAPFTTGESSMSAVVATEIIIPLAKKLVSMLPMFSSGSPRAERNVQVTQELAREVFAVARKAVPDAPNEQAMVQRIESDPIARQTFVAEAAMKWKDIEPYMQYESAEREKARTFAQQMTDGPTWRAVGYGVLIAVLSLLIVCGIGYVFWHVLFFEGDRFSPSTRDGIIEVLKNVAILVIGFYFGSSVGSKQSARSIERIAERQ